MMSNISEIKLVQWATLSSQQLQALSVVNCTAPSPKDFVNKPAARIGTPSDPRMGEQRDGVECETCHQYNSKCPGHFGTILLPFPIYNKDFVTYVLKTLQSVCTYCKKPRIFSDHFESQSFAKYKGFERLKLIAEKSKAVRVCPWCKEPCLFFTQAKKADSGVIHYHTFNKKNSKNEEYSASDAFEVLSNISFEHSKLLGFNGDLLQNKEYTDPKYLLDDSYVHAHQFKPESMIYTVLPVLSPLARPFVQDDNEIKEDDLTAKYDSLLVSINTYKTIIATGESLPSRRGYMKTKVSVAAEIMEHVWTLANNKEEKSKIQNGSKSHRSIACRIIKKEGRVQQNVMGKRVDFTARSVAIGGGIRLRNDEVGVPMEIAEVETYETFVGAWNIKDVQALVLNGKVNRVKRWVINTNPATSKRHRFIIKKTRLDTLPDHGRDFIIQIGDTVDRQMQDGDIVIINRQPTLRDEGMEGFRAKLFDCLPFILGLQYTNAFNADFDGDEINMHVPQSIQAQVEVQTNSRCAVHLVSGQNNAPVNGIVQDGLVGSLILTTTWECEEECLFPRCKTGSLYTMVSKRVAMMVYEEMPVSENRIQSMLKRAYNVPEWKEYIKITSETECEAHYEFVDDVEGIPGMLFYSILFPEDFVYSRVTTVEPKKPKFKIKHGIILPSSGPVCKKIIGGKAGSIIHVLWKRSPEIALYFISECQQLVDRWYPTHGFSMGVSDFMSINERDVAKILIETRTNIADMIAREKDPAKIELEAMRILGDAMAVGNTLAKNNMVKGQINSLNICRKSGAKGSIINLTQIIAFVGQQDIKGKRMPKQITHGTRCLPSFLPNDNSPDARGFVENNYLRGLTPQEYYFHSAAGRNGVIATSHGTAIGGYTQKRMARKLEDLTVCIDGTVRGANGKIYSWMYGDDGMNPKKLVNVKGLDFPFFVDPFFVAKQINSGVIQRGEHLSFRDGSVEKKEYLTSSDIEILLGYIKYSGIDSPMIKCVTKNCHEILRELLPKVKLYRSKIAVFFKEIRDTYVTSKAPYGMMAGLSASSSIGEPGTQTTLNVFHLAGVRGKDVSGVPRLNQIMNTTKSKDLVGAGCMLNLEDDMFQQNTDKILELESRLKLVADSCDNHQKEEIESQINLIKQDSFKALSAMKRDLEETHVEDFLIDHQLSYRADKVSIPEGLEPLGLLVYPEYKPEWWVTLHSGLSNVKSEPSSWVVTLTFDVEKMYERRINLEDIAEAIEDKSDNHFVCITSPCVIGKIEVYTSAEYLNTYAKGKIGTANLEKGVITHDNIDYFVCRDAVVHAIRKTHIMGIKGIKKVYPVEVPLTHEFKLETEGSNFPDAINNPMIDSLNSKTDDIHAIRLLLGIEAARRVIFDEALSVTSADGGYVNHRHISTLADAMTVSGTLTAASRDGISRDVGPNAKIVFEETIDNAAIASVFSEIDPMRGTASSVMFGKLAKAGTGVVTVREKESTKIIEKRVEVTTGSTLTTGEAQRCQSKMSAI